MNWKIPSSKKMFSINQIGKHMADLDLYKNVLDKLSNPADLIFLNEINETHFNIINTKSAITRYRNEKMELQEVELMKEEHKLCLNIIHFE